jgi:hypothetical protein
MRKCPICGKSDIPDDIQFCPNPDCLWELVMWLGATEQDKEIYQKQVEVARRNYLAAQAIDKGDGAEAETVGKNADVQKKVREDESEKLSENKVEPKVSKLKRSIFEYEQIFEFVKRNRIKIIVFSIVFVFSAIVVTIIYNGLYTIDQKIEHIQRDQNLVQDTLRNGVNISILIHELERANTILEKAQKLADISSRYQENLVILEKPISGLEDRLDKQMQEYQKNIAKLNDPEVVNIASYLESQGQNTLSSREMAVAELILSHIRKNNSSDHANTKACLESFQKKFIDFVD